MEVGTQTTKVFLEWFEKHLINETTAHCILVGLDPKYKTVLLFDNRYLPEYCLSNIIICRKCIYLQTTPQSLAVGI
jgi:hypothetical protein